MRRGQILLLVVMVIIAIILLGTAIIWGLPLVNSESIGPIDEPEIATKSSPTPTDTATPTETLVFTATPTPTETPIPTETPTRVVNNTATPTPSKTPWPTATPINTPPSASNGGSSLGGSIRTGPQPIPTPTSRYPFQIVEGPVAYDTDNHFLVILAKVTKNEAILGNYRIVGFHSPSGLNWKSVPSCGHLCKASGPAEIVDADGKVIKRFPIQEGNLFFEFPYYEEGFWALMIVDPQGYQVSEAFFIKYDGMESSRKW